MTGLELPATSGPSVVYSAALLHDRGLPPNCLPPNCLPPNCLPPNCLQPNCLPPGRPARQQQGQPQRQSWQRPDHEQPPVAPPQVARPPVEPSLHCPRYTLAGRAPRGLAFVSGLWRATASRGAPRSCRRGPAELSKSTFSPPHPWHHARGRPCRQAHPGRQGLRPTAQAGRRPPLPGLLDSILNADAPPGSNPAAPPPAAPHPAVIFRPNDSGFASHRGRCVGGPARSRALRRWSESKAAAILSISCWARPRSAASRRQLDVARSTSETMDLASPSRSRKSAGDGQRCLDAGARIVQVDRGAETVR